MIIYVILYTLLEFINVTMAYNVIFNIKLKRNKYIYIFTVIVVWIIQMINLKLGDIIWVDIINIIFGFCIPLFFTERNKIKNVLLYPIVFMGTSFINTLASYILAFVLNISQRDIVNSHFYTLLSELAAIGIMIIIHFVKKKRDQSNKLWELNVRQYMIILIGFICFAFMIGFMQMIEEGTIFLEARTLGLAMTVCCIIFMLLCLWQVITFEKKQMYFQKNLEYENYMRKQEESVKILIEKDKSMRAFRHDFHAHITALEAIAEKIQNEELQEYIIKMKNESIMYARKKYSGITVVDAVVSEIIEKSKELNISVQWEGILEEGKKADIFDLCIIFSNLLKNAAEACEELEEKDRVIYVKTNCYDEHIYIDVKNRCKEKVIIDKNGEIKTTKGDKRNHGFGTKNIRDTVTKNKGNIQYLAEDGWFEVRIVI